jgi:hypothetical protein
MKRFYRLLTISLLVLTWVIPASAATETSGLNMPSLAIGSPDVCNAPSESNDQCPTDLAPSSQGPNSATRPLSSITFASGEAQGQPQQAASRFAQGVEQLYAFFDYQTLSNSDVLSGVWYRGGRTLLRQTTTLAEIFGDDPPSAGTLWFTARVHGGFTPGIYRLEISVGNRLVQAGEFSVEPVGNQHLITDVTFARSVNAAAGSVRYPVVAASQFPLGARQAYAVFDFFGMDGSVRWGWRISREGAVIKESGIQPWPAQASGSFALPIDLPTEPGLYDFDLLVDGRWTQADSFTVGDPTPPVDRLLMRDDFRSQASGWTVSKDRGGEEAYDNGQYVITLNSTDPYWGVNPQILGDFVAEVDATPTSRYGTGYAYDGPLGDSFGVIVRAQDKDNFYAFLVATDGRYGVFHVKNGDLVWDTQWTVADDDLVKDGWQTSHLRILALGSELRFYLNGRMLARVPDAIWASGQAGMIASNAYADLFSGEKVDFSHWRAWSVPSAAAPDPTSDHSTAG